MKNNNSIYSPQTLDQAKELAQLLTIKGNPRESLVAHATFGHHFGGNMAVTLANSFVLQGKPSLGADAMSGIVRASGLCRFMRITEWNDSVCVMEFARTDEPSEITHTHTFTMEMAVKQGLTNNRNWKQMPRQMLRARVLAEGIRTVFPGVMAGTYTVEEVRDFGPGSAAAPHIPHSLPGQDQEGDDLAAIASAQDMDALKAAFTSAYKLARAASDDEGIARLEEAKNRRKAELEGITGEIVSG